MSTPIAYTVCTTFQDSSLADQWITWLREGHVAQVLAGGATDALIIELDQPEVARSFEVRYYFSSMQSFENYEKNHAPALRAEGLKLFPVEKGVTYRRSVGRVIEHMGDED